MSHGCARCSSPSNRRPCPASCRPAQPGAQQGKGRLTEPGGSEGPAQEGPHPTCPLLPGAHLGCESLVVTLPTVFLCLKGASVSFYTYLLLWHFPGKRHWVAELSDWGRP